MRGFTKLPKSYFEKYSDKPVKIIPFNPKSKLVAREYMIQKNNFLEEIVNKLH